MSTLTIRRRYTGPRVHEGKPKDGRRQLLHTTVAQLVALGWPQWLATNVMWWRYRHGLSLVVSKVLP